MAPYGVAITKSANWRGAEEEFSNVYHYDINPAPDEDKAAALINAIVAQEKTTHTNLVLFKRARLFGPTDQGPAANKMIAVVDLLGTGTYVVDGPIPYEMSVVCQIYIGRGPAGGKRFIRKYYHTCGLAGITAGGHPQLGNAALPSGAKVNASTCLQNLKSITVEGDTMELCTPDGTHIPADGGDVLTLPYLHVRQFRR